jgi:hypothetical protein
VDGIGIDFTRRQFDPDAPVPDRLRNFGRPRARLGMGQYGSRWECPRAQAPGATAAGPIPIGRVGIWCIQF